MLPWKCVVCFWWYLVRDKQDPESSLRTVLSDILQLQILPFPFWDVYLSLLGQSLWNENMQVNKHPFFSLPKAPCFDLYNCLLSKSYETFTSPPDNLPIKFLKRICSSPSLFYPLLPHSPIKIPSSMCSNQSQVQLMLDPLRHHNVHSSRRCHPNTCHLWQKDCFELKAILKNQIKQKLSLPSPYLPKVGT
jgi:hypothetical protein